MPRSNPYSYVPKAPTELDLLELGGGREIELEIGFGRGHFILGRAIARPDVQLLGLEVRRKWVAKTSERAEREGLDNVCVYFGDARFLLPGWGPDGALSAVFVNFPDPWWKKRHLKRLVLVPDNLAQFTRLLRPGGQLFIQTDVAERAEGYRKVVEGFPELRPAGGGETGGPVPSSNPMHTQSHREKKCLDVEIPVFRLLYERV